MHSGLKNEFKHIQFDGIRKFLVKMFQNSIITYISSQNNIVTAPVLTESIKNPRPFLGNI